MRHMFTTAAVMMAVMPAFIAGIALVLCRHRRRPNARWNHLEASARCAALTRKSLWKARERYWKAEL